MISGSAEVGSVVVAEEEVCLRVPALYSVL